MKIKINQRLVCCLALMALSAVNPQFSTANAAVTCTLTPFAVSNTYGGQITMTISNLPSGGSVVVQKFIDANTNGVIDGKDWLVQQFTMTDGQPGMAFGGVTNFNVPGDTDGAANGTITAKLNFQGGDFAQNFVGKYLVKVSGNFSPPLTNVFTVTNFPFAQKFTGNVVSNGTSTVVSNATVMLMSPGGGPVAGAIANNAGSYTIMAPAGTYSLMAFRSNYLANFGNAPTVTLGSGATVTTNVSVANATASISGKLVDANNSSIGLPGVLVTAQGNTGLMGIGFTDTNGNFVLGAQSGQWQVKADDTSLIVHGYLGLQNQSDVNAGATGVTIAVPKATALIYGSLKDNLGNPFAGLDVYADDQNNNQYETDAYTDANGNYVLGVLGLGDNDSWYVDANDNNQVTNYVFSNAQLPNNGAIAAGTAVLQNFTAVLATNFISGNVKFNGASLAGVWVSVSATIGDTYYQTGMDTDNNGNYSLNVLNGSWSVGLDTCGGGDSLDNLLGSGNYVAPLSQTANIATKNATNNFLVLQPTSQITGNVQDSNNNPVAGVGVYADATIGSENYEAWTGTDSNGNYSLNVVNGNWNVNILCDGGSPCGNYNSLDNILGYGNYFCPDVRDVNMATGNGTANFTIELPPPLQMTTTSLPDGTVGVYYDQSLSATGGQPPYWWWLPDGTITLPPGTSGDMNFSCDGTSGIISGIPGTAGTYSFRVCVSDNASPQNVVTQTYSITIELAAAPLQVTTTWLPYGTNGSFYSQTLQASGGTLPYSWSIPPWSGSLPPNLTLATNGVLSGTPSATAMTYQFDVIVTDAAANTYEKDGLALTIVNPPPPPLVITNASLPSGTVGLSYTAQLGATGGRSPYSWSLAAGSANPPPGLTLYSSGLISGTPTTNSLFYFKVQATDENYTTTNKVLSIAVNAASKPVISSPARSNGQFRMLLSGVAGQNYTLQLSTNLASTNWTALFVTNNATTNSFILTDSQATNSPRFYRVMVGP